MSVALSLISKYPCVLKLQPWNTTKYDKLDRQISSQASSPNQKQWPNESDTKDRQEASPKAGKILPAN
jgi:hypothetical protein